MKTNLKALLFCFIAFFAILILWLCRRGNESKLLRVIQTSNTNTPSVQNTVMPNTTQRQMNTNVGTFAMPVVSSTSQTNLITPETKLSALVEDKNKPIDFWGLVIDQDGNPLEGAKIAGNTRTWHMTKTLNFDADFPAVNAVSDANGKFEIHQVSGDVLTIKSLEKEGYEPEPGALRGFGYNTSERFSSDPDNPIVFTMWKTNIHQQLIMGKKRFHIVPDGRAYVIDLSKGTIAESSEGDLKIWIKYQKADNGLYDWSSEIDVINGGLLQETDAYSPMYLAPAEGYKPVFQYPSSPQQIKKGQRGRTGQHRFYIMLKNGQEFGQISVDLIAPYNDQIPGLIEIQYAINPSGSRILKP